MKKPARIFILANLAVLAALMSSACGAGSPPATPTLSVAAIQTDAVSTYAAGLTQTAFSVPTSTPTSTPASTATPSSLPAPIVAVPTSSCYGLTGISDVSIPDNTPMVPGQTFTKTWRVKNSGTCLWGAGFKFSFISGDAMGGSTLVLDQTVNPGAETNLSINMTAPSRTGAARGNWQMSNLAGMFFGDEEYIIIVLGGTPTPTSTATSTIPAATRTITITIPAATSTATITNTVVAPTPTDTPTQTPTS